MQIMIDIKILKSVALFKGVSDIRHYLNGLYIESGPLGARLVACDGYTMAVAQIEGEYSVSSIIIPGAMIDAIKADKHTKAVLIEYDDSSERKDRQIKITAGASANIAQELDGRFPDWRRVCPTSLTGEQATYQSVYHQRVQKAGEILSGNKTGNYSITQNGTGPGVAWLHDDMFAIVMPLRHEPIQGVPNWLTVSLVPRDEKLAA